MLLVAAVVAVATVASLSPKPVGDEGASSSLTSYIQKGVAVSDSTLEYVGLPATVTAPNSVPDGTALTADGKPVVVFVGAEFCPSAPWSVRALVVALFRFGTFSNLGQSDFVVIHRRLSRPPELEFRGFEVHQYVTRVRRPRPSRRRRTPLALDTTSPSLTALQSQAWNTYGNHGYPFVDIGGRYVALGASANPGVLQNLTLNQIASQLDDPSSAVAQAVDGTTNSLIAAMCSVTSTSAAPICSAPFIAQAQAGMTADPHVPGG